MKSNIFLFIYIKITLLLYINETNNETTEYIPRV